MAETSLVCIPLVGLCLLAYNRNNLHEEAFSMRSQFQPKGPGPRLLPGQRLIGLGYGHRIRHRFTGSIGESYDARLDVSAVRAVLPHFTFGGP